ncbi:hypothetical protein HPB48_011244 [Haemaphysalis longicornis]|uniref:C2H2-type domain-containing protein n=1 Tax=Haemaphysalis longicornis TaxID=44386 RepID=A0A9J6FD89_HAELO|nr:hypothetical protein HPB48_011244 [Haemaphysalis longicornis]
MRLVTVPCRAWRSRLALRGARAPLLYSIMVLLYHIAESHQCCICSLVVKSCYEDKKDLDSTANSKDNTTVCGHDRGVKTRKGAHRCQLCRYTSDSKDDLMRHVRIHFEEKPFKCNVCSHAFRYMYRLTIHMRTHTGEKPFSCNLCPWAFNEKGSLLAHVKKHHPMYNASNISVVPPSGKPGRCVRALPVLSRADGGGLPGYAVRTRARKGPISKTGRGGGKGGGAQPEQRREDGNYNARASRRHKLLFV